VGIISSQTKPTTMVHFNTQWRVSARFPFPKVFKALPHVPNVLKTGFAATLLLCCLSQNSLQAQCDIGYVSGSAINLSLDNTGTTTLNSNVFVPFVTSSYPQCLPINGATLSIWEDINATIPYPTALTGPVFNCAQVGTVLTVFVTLDDPGPGTQSAAIPFVVTIVDNVPPVVTWPSNVTASADAGACSKLVTSLTPSVSDNCPASIMVTWTRTGDTPGSGTGSANGIYNVGSTDIDFTVTDGTTILTQTVTVTITDDENPVLSPCPGNIVVSNDPGVCNASVSWTPPTATDNCPGVGVTSNLSSPTLFAVGGPYGITYTATDGSGNTDQCSFTVTVDDTEAPVLTGPPLPASIIVSPSPACSQFVSLDGGGATDNCGLDLTNYTDGFSFSIATTAGGPPPTASGTNSDASGIYPVGIYDITYTAHDIYGNTTAYTINLVVEDQLNPVAVCQDITVQLDANGSATVTGMDIDGGSSDNCGIMTWNIAHDVAPTDGAPDGPGPTFWFASRTFGCANIATTNTVLLQVVDGNNNTDVCSAVVTVEDNLPPVALCQDITVDLITGAPPSVDVFAEGTSPFIDNGSHDNCTSPLTDFGIRKGTSGAFNAIGVPVTFLCGEIGANTVEIQVTDAQGNSNICQATVTVRDVTPPVAAAIDITVSLSGSIPGQVTVCGSDIGNMSTDDCSIVSYEIGFSSSGPWSTCTTFDCADLGGNSVWLRVTDAGGNSTVTGFVTVTVEDNTPPNAQCIATFAAQLDATGNVTVVPNDIDAGSTDNCTIISRTVSPNMFDCSDIAGNPYTVFLTVTDQSSNVSICTTAVTVVDNIAPVAICNNINVALGSDGMADVFPFQIAAFSTDNCCVLTGLMSVDTDGDGIPDSPFDPGVFTFDCSYIGDVVVEIQMVDCATPANTAICQATVTVQDNEDPVITCPPDVTIECDQSLDPNVNGALGFATATDNCTVANIDFVDNTIPGLCTGDYVVLRTWTAYDEQTPPNTDACTQTITVVDTTPPTFTAPGDATLNCPDSYTVANHLCDTYTSTNVPVFISPSGTPTVTSILVVPDNGKITDINVVDLQIEHTWVGDLTVTLTSPGGTVVTLADFSSCGPDDNVEINFDDAGTPGFPCPPTDNGFYIPSDPLSWLNTEQINGTWTLTVIDNFDGDGGNIIGWGLGICYVNQPGDLSLVGDVTDEADNCGPMPNALYTDYHAYKDFIFHNEGGMYDFSIPGFWIPTELPGPHDGFVNTGGAPGSISLTGADDGTFGAETNYGIPIPPGGTGPFYVAFDWDYQSTNSAASWDPFGYKINGTFFPLTEVNGCMLPGIGSTSQNGRVLIPVSPGDFFEFSQQACDGLFGPATTTITNFVFIDGGMPIPVDDCPRKFCIGRVWNLEDDCGNAATNQLQIIQTQDVTPPDVAFPNTVTILADGGICTPLVDLDLSQEITDGCSAFADLTITNDALMNYGNGNGTFDASGFYTPGLYTITFEVTDECGNTTTHVIDLEVIDAQAPFAICNPAITVQLDNNGNATLLPVNVDNGSSDNCGIVDMTLNGAPQINFGLGDIGQVVVTLEAIDAAGNTNTCTSLVTVLGGVIFDAQDASGPNGGMADVPVTTMDFDQVTGFSMDIEITNGAVATTTFPVQPGGVTVLENQLNTGGVFTFVINSPTQVSVNWFSNSPSGLSLADGTPLFSVKTNLVGPTGSSTPVVINNDEVFTVPGGILNPVPSIGLSGTITILNTAIEHTISGTLTREDNCLSPTGDPVNNVTVTLSGAASTPPSPDTDADGSYSFSVADGSSFTITPSKDGTTTGLPTPGTWFTGIDILDVLAVNEHFLGITLLNSNFKKIAADANKSSTINIADVFIINQLSLFNFPTGLNNTAWRFVDGSFAFPPSAPLVVPAFPESATVNSIGANTTRDFTGVKVGDVDCTANTNLFTNGNTSDGQGGRLPFFADDQNLTEGQEVTVAFMAKDFIEVKGYQMTVRFDADALQFQSFQPGALVGLSEGNLNPMMADQGFIATNWFGFEPADLADGETVFTLTFTAEENGKLSDVLDINSEFIKAMAVKADGDIMGVDLEFDAVTATSENSSDGFALYQNRPNPFSHRTAIGFNLPESTSATLTILDPAGRVLKLIEGDFTAGYHQVIIDRDDLPAKGILFYRLETPKHQAVRKMVLMD
jgi:subtilisin-like proprotein convertase family protein